MKKATSLILLILFPLSCLCFFYFKYNDYGLYSLIVSKLLPSVLLCTWLLLNKHSRKGLLVLAGLVFSLLCDLFMEIPGGNFQIYGIASNILGLLLYTAYFVTSCKISNLFGLAPVGIIVMTVFSVIAPNLYGLFIPVLVYCLICVVFTWRAFTRLRDPGIAALSQRLCMLGSVCVICSDSLLSFLMFSIVKQSFVYAVINMSLWWAGLFLLAMTAGSKERIS